MGRKGSKRICPRMRYGGGVVLERKTGAKKIVTLPPGRKKVGRAFMGRKGTGVGPRWGEGKKRRWGTFRVGS